MAKRSEQDFRNKRITVMGLGHFGGGIEVSRWLVKQGANVLVTDKAPADKLAESIAKLQGLPIEFRLGEHVESDFTSPDLLVISPAVPPTNPYLQIARQSGVPVALEIQFFLERCPSKIIGITATKGKSTTTSMLGAMLRQQHTVHVGGNLGGSLLKDLPNIQANDLVVLELSSYMLEHLKRLRWSPHVALVGMIERDHLEWHGSEQAYVEAKKNIVRFQLPDDFAILNGESPAACGFANETRGKVIRFGTNNSERFNLNIAGEHNQLNAQGAFAAAQIFGIMREQAQRAMSEFTGLPHRLELVHESGGVKWIDDSIATIPEAAVAAMRAFPRGRVIQIIGGSDKKLDMREMCQTLARECKAILTVAQLGPQLAEFVRQTPDRSAELHECGSIEVAASTASKIACSGDVILLSTGCASYGQFGNFEERGELFTKLARSV